MTNLQTRAVSGAVYVALLVLTCIFTEIGFLVLMLVFCGIGVTEFHNMTDRPEDGGRILGIVKVLDIIMAMTGVLSAASLADIGKMTSDASDAITGIFVVALPLIVVLYFVGRIGVAFFSRQGNPTRALAYSLLCVAYISIGLQAAVMAEGMAPGLVLITFILIWVNDTGAYLTGRTFGKHKMCVHLSPKKTWEGFFGGLVLCIIVGAVISLTGFGRSLFGNSRINLLDFYSMPNMCLLFPVTVVILSTCGDLFESMIKRNAGVKDSGTIIPGHGGVLDRIDSMLFVFPGVVMLVLTMVLLRYIL